MARIKYKEAIGMKVKKGRPSIGRKPERKELQRLYIKESKSIREVAEILECSKDMVYRSLNEHAIERRPDNKRSKLRNYDKAFLKREIKQKGITQTAKELAVNISTLKKYIS
jgi:DNA-directed RNA polymerase specialized sigma24 family protein